MNSAWYSRAACLGLVLLLGILAPASYLMAQEGEYVVPPRDTLLAAAKDIMAQVRFCVLITLDETGHPHARAMDPFMPDENWMIWMGTSHGTRKTKDIKNDPRVTLYYDHPEHSGYVVVYGTAKLVNDSELKAKWFKEEWAQFYTDREKEYVLIAVTPKKIEVLDYTKGITGHPETWRTPTVKF
jgi:general stress protein 26